MKTKQATVELDGETWVVLDTGDRLDGKVFCALTKHDQTIVLHAWVDEQLIRGIT
jgi:hypothetical protein